MNSLSSNIPAKAGKVKGYYYPDNGYSTYLVSYFFDDGNIKAFPAAAMPKEIIPNSTLYPDLYPTYADAFNAALSAYPEIYREETGPDACFRAAGPRRFAGAWETDADGNPHEHALFAKKGGKA
ncbi:MAG: hypothetical protein LBD55_04285 [Treponema sp.]|jgi:hypothetical protein|nr:hypothetical protein [Treponema sp.]